RSNHSTASRNPAPAVTNAVTPASISAKTLDALLSGPVSPPRDNGSPVDAHQRYQASERRELEPDPEGRRQRVRDHRTEAVLRRRGTRDVDRIRNQPAGEERSRERHQWHGHESSRDEQ